MKRKKENKKPISKARRAFNIITTIISSIFFAFLVVCVALVFVSKIKGDDANLFGYRFLYILTDSMEPELPVGSSILVKNASAEDVKVGDYVCYYTSDELQEASGVKYLTHKCVEALHEDSETGKMVIITQGIKEGAPVDPAVEADRVNAIFVGKVPTIFNSFFAFILTPYGLVTLIAIPLVVALALQLMSQIKQIKAKETQKTDAELLQEEISKQTAILTQEAQDFFLSEQEKIRKFIEEHEKKNEKE